MYARFLGAVKMVVVASVLICLVGVGLFIYRYNDPLAYHLKDRLQKQLEESLNYRVDWEKVVLFPAHRLTVEGVSLQNPGEEPFMSADRLVVGYNLWDVLFGRVGILESINEIDIYGVAMQVDMDEIPWPNDGSLALPGAFTASVNVHGAELDLCWGERWERIHIPAAGLAPAQDGTWRGEIQGQPAGIPGADLVVTGFFGPRQPAVIDLDFNGFDALYLIDLLAYEEFSDLIYIQAGKLDGSLQVAVNKGGFDYTGAFDLREGRVHLPYADAYLEDIDAELQIEPGLVTMKSLAFDLYDSRLWAGGSINLATEQVDLKVEMVPVVLADLQVMAERLGFYLDMPTLSGGGTAVLHIRGDLDNPLLAGDILLDQVELGGVDLADIKFYWRWQEDILIIDDFYARYGTEGRVTLHGEVQPGEQSPYFALQVAVANIDLTSLPPGLIMPEWLERTGRLNGRFFVSGAGFKFHELMAVGSFDLDHGRAFSYPLQYAEASFWLTGGQVLLSPLHIVDRKGGNLTLQGVADQYGYFEFRVQAEDIELGSFLSDLQGKGSFTGNIWGDFQDINLAGDLQGRDVVWQQQELGRIEGGISSQGNRIYLHDVEIKHTLGGFLVNGHINLAGKPQVALQGKLNAPSFKGLADYLEVGLPWELEGLVQGELAVEGDWDEYNVYGNLSLVDGRLDGQTFQSLQTYFQWQGEAIVLDYLTFSMGEGRLQGWGTVSTHAEMDLYVELLDFSLVYLGLFLAEEWLADMQGEITASGRLQGQLARPDFSGGLLIKDLWWAGEALGDLKGNFDLKDFYVDGSFALNSPWGVYTAEGGVDLEAGEIEAVQLEFQESSLARILVLLGYDHLWPRGLPPLLVAGTGALAGPISNPVFNIEGDFNYQGDYLFFTGNGTLGGQYILELKGERMALTFFQDFLPAGVTLAGVGDLNLIARYNGGWEITGSNSFTDVQVLDFHLQEIRGHFSWNEETELILNQRLQRNDDYAFLNGRIPLDPELRGMEVDFWASDLSVDFLPYFNPYVLSSQGKADLEVTLRGSPQDPRFYGTVIIKDGGFVHHDVPGPVDNVQGEIILDGNRLTFENMRGNFNQKGELTLTGYMLTSGWLFSYQDLVLTGSGLPVNHGAVNGFGDGMVTVQGPYFASQVEGVVEVYNTTVRLPFVWPQEELAGVPPSPFQHEVAIIFQPRSNVKIKDINYDVLVQGGELQLDNQTGQYEAVGEAYSRQGSLYYYNTHFRLVEARARFLRFGQSIPYVSLKAQTRIQDTQVFITLDGPALDMQVKLTSSPAMDEDSILELLVRRGGLGHLLVGDLGGVVREEFWRLFGEGLRSAFLAQLEMSMEEVFALDEFSIIPLFDGSDGVLHLHMGKALSDHFYITYSQSFFGDRDEKQLGFEFKIRENIRLEGMILEEGNFQFSIDFVLPF